MNQKIIDIISGETYIKDGSGNQIQLTETGGIKYPYGDGLIVTTDVLTADFQPSTNGVFEDTGLSVDVTTETNEQAHVTFSGNVYSTTGDYMQVFIRILDGATVIREGYISYGTGVLTSRTPFTLDVYHTFAAGTNTVKVQMQYVTSGQSSFIQGGDDTNDQRGRLQVVQFRTPTQTVVKEILNWSPTSDTSISATLVDIAGVANQTISIPTSGEYMFDLNVNGAYNDLAGQTDWVFAIIIDDTTTHEFPLAAIDSNTRENISAKLKATLTQGSRDIRVQWRRAGGSNTMTVDGSTRINLSIT